MTAIGVLSNVGSRHETTPGIVHTLQTMAFGSTENLDGPQIADLMQTWGATNFASHNREQTLHCMEILRPNAHLGMRLLSEVCLYPKIAENDEFYGALDAMAFQAQELPPQLLLAEAIQVAAYGSDQQLGQFHFATPDAIANLTPTLVNGFVNDCIKNNPQNMVISGVGISHDHLVDIANESFGHISQKSAPTTIPSTYRGGSFQIPKPKGTSVLAHTLPEEDCCHVALGFPVGGWHSDSMVTACVLQMLLGGGSSFSAGGPGKGMYSRMYQQVLKRYAFLESAEAFTGFACEGGLFGVSGSTSHPSRVEAMIKVLTEQLHKLARTPVTPIELSRARNMLKCNVLTQLESRLVIFEDIGRQLLTYDKIEDAASTCTKIDAVTAEDILELVQTMLQEKPTLASAGSHLEHVPSYSEVSSWFH